MMKRSNVDGIVSPDGITDCLMVQEFLSPGVHEIVHQIISNMVGSQFYILETELKGFRVTDIQAAVLKHPVSMQVIGVVRDGEQKLNPPGDMMIEDGDRLIILAQSSDDFKVVEKDVLAGKAL